MSPSKPRARPVVEQLDDRVVMSASVPTSLLTSAAVNAPARPVPGSHPSANPDRPFTPADLIAYATAYLSHQGEPEFTPRYDFNGTGFIGQDDATPILRGLAAITPRIPLTLTLKIAPGEQVPGHHPANSGGVTRLGTVTIIGKTTPNSIVFIDGATNNPNAGSTNLFKFEGGALATDAQGHFAYTEKLSAASRGGSLTTAFFLIRTPFNQQVIRVFPTLRIR